MKKIIIMLLAVLFIPFSFVKAADQNATFRVMTQSDSGDYIGQGKPWDFSNSNNSKITAVKADGNTVELDITNFSVSNLSFSFAAESGKTLSSGLYFPAKRFPFRDSYDGIEVSGDGRGCNTILGAFYVHEYVVNNGVLERAAIDFVQICEPKSGDINEQSPKLVGSIRYNSSVPDSCDSGGCAEARKNLGLSAQSALSVPADTPGGQASIIGSVSSLVANNDFNRSIVKIRSYELSDYNGLKAVAEGSGAVISSGGIVLTNDHVVSTRSELDNSLYDASYQICVVKELNEKPSCDYLAKVIARDEEKDLALLQIVERPGGNALILFKPLALSPSDSTNVNDQITAVGFPAIGGDTITVTGGIVSGKDEKYGNQWIKTDAVVAYGSSGGAALNKAGEIIGITTQVHSDTSGELGYILSVNSINDWVDNNINKNPENSKLFGRLADLSKKQKILETSNLYINLYPYFTFVKPVEWTFSHLSEENVSVINENSQDSGYMTVNMLKTPYELPFNASKARLKRTFNEAGVSGILKFAKEKDVVIGGSKAKQITMTLSNRVVNSYLLPINNYLVLIEYSYGKNDKDKRLVDDMIASFKTKKLKPNYQEVRSYKNPLPKFSINSDKDWAILLMNNKLQPAQVYSKKIGEAYVNFSVEKISESEAGLSDEEFINMQKDMVNSLNQQTKALDYKVEIGKTAKNVKINNQVRALRMDSVEKNATQNKILAFDRDYYVKIGNYRLTINLTVYSDNKSVYNKSLLEFNKLLSGLKLN